MVHHSPAPTGCGRGTPYLGGCCCLQSEQCRSPVKERGMNTFSTLPFITPHPHTPNHTPPTPHQTTYPQHTSHYTTPIPHTHHHTTHTPTWSFLLAESLDGGTDVFLSLKGFLTAAKNGKYCCHSSAQNND